MKKLAALLWLLFTAQGAIAQTFPVPPDIAAIYGSTGWIPSTATYAAGTTANVLGNGTTNGGTPPAYATMPADIPTPSRTNWLLSGTYTAAGADYCTVGVELDINGNPCTEPKFRTHATYSHVLFDDPIRNYGQPGTSHCHMFFGNRGANAFSTYATLRNKRSSTAAGGELNATAYWFPCVQKNVGGTLYAIKTNYHVIYYNTVTDAERVKAQRIPRAFRYVLGFDMDDPDDTLVKKEIATANAQPGTAGRYVLPVAGYGHGIVGWQCVGGSNAASGTFRPYLKEADGTDPFQNTYGATCPSGTFLMTLSAPECWDGQNLWSPGGYRHVRYTIIDNQAPGDHLICPNGWYKLPQLQLIFIFSHTGVADYSTWRLSSDDMAATKLNSLPTCTAGYANAPCNDGGGVRTIRNGESFHTDWLGGWDDTTMVAWQTNCLGLFGAANSHQCPPSIFSSTQGLSYGPMPDGGTVTTTGVHSSTNTADMVKLGTAHKGPVTIHHHN